MGKYRKKPVLIEAVQFKGNLIAVDPEGVCRCLVLERLESGEGKPHVHTIEGALHVSPDDWIITGIKGERYPCKPDIFEATYEEVTNAHP